MSQFCYLTHWRQGLSNKPPPNESTKSKAVRKLICFLTTPARAGDLIGRKRGIQNVSITNKG